MSLDLDKLSKLFEVASHLRDLPQYKNLSAEVSKQIQALDDDAATPEQKAAKAKAEADAKPKPVARAIPSSEFEKNPNYVPPKAVASKSYADDNDIDRRP